jgi:hypothetical protein
MAKSRNRKNKKAWEPIIWGAKVALGVAAAGIVINLVSTAGEIISSRVASTLRNRSLGGGAGGAGAIPGGNGATIPGMGAPQPVAAAQTQP